MNRRIPRKFAPLYIACIILSITLAAIIVTCLNAYDKHHLKTDPDGSVYDSYGNHYYQEYTISRIELCPEYANLTISLSSGEINDYLDKLKASGKNNYQTGIMLQSGQIVVIVFSKEDLENATKLLEKSKCTNFKFQTTVEYEYAPPEALINSVAYVLFPQDLKHFAAIMKEKNLEYYDIPTPDKGYYLHLSYEEAISYLAIAQKTGGLPVTIVPGDNPGNPVIQFFEDLIPEEEETPDSEEHHNLTPLPKGSLAS